MGLSPYLSGALLDASLGGPPVQFGSPPYMALVTELVAWADTGSTITEPIYIGYNRVPVPGWALDDAGVLASSPQIALPPYASGPGATVIGWALCDLPLGGNVGWSGLVTAFEIDAADPAPVWAPGAILINLASSL